MQVVNVAGGIEVDNIGSYNAAAGRVDLVGFRPTAIVGSAIKVSAIPANQSTIRPLRASILNIDSEISKANSVLDYQQTQVSLGGTTTTTTSTASTSSSTSSSSSGY